MDAQFGTVGGSVVAGGRFAPGHLGELTRLVPFEMVDEALAATGAVQSRLRVLPSRVVVYLLLAGGLFPEVGYRGVWRKLTGGLGAGAVPSGGGLAQARRRVGVAPLRWLFDLLRGPAAGVRTPGVWWRGLLVCAIDGTTISVPDSPANRRVWAKQPGNHGGAGYPHLRLVALVACGTRTVIDAVFGPASRGEPGYATDLAGSLRAGMLLLADRNFGACALLRTLTGSGAQVMVRLTTNRRTPVVGRCPDGSYLSCLGGVSVRVIEAEITIATAVGRHTGVYRLATTLLDHHAYPATDLVALYHERWEIETAYLELKSTILGGRVLRARTPTGVHQEVYALLVTYQLLRTAIADATTTQPGTDPDRGSFTIAFHTARDQLIQATTTATATDLAGTIGRQVLAALLPPRRLRVNPRIVKRAISKYQARGPQTNRTTYKATTTIHILTPPTPLTTTTNP